MATEPFRLSASLKGHREDVRAVLAPAPDLVISSSRDFSVRLWHRDPAKNTYSETVNSHGSGFINSLAWIPPSAEHSQGLVVSGGAETLIEAREPTGLNRADPDYLMLGHAHNVCALDAHDGILVSGSWDSKARVWKNWETVHVLEGHEGSVWTVLVLNEREVLTGSADKTIRLWKDGKQVKIIGGHTDVVRGLCRLPQGGFASCGNDAVIRIWSKEGHKLQELHGHASFIYSIAAFPSGELVSSGEDRTMRIWKDGNCIQTVTHPAISVWSVAVCAETGDVVSGASDRIVRVFSRDKSRWADAETQKEFDDSVSASSIPSNQVGDVNKEKLSGLEALQRAGTKDGQVIMVRNGDSVEAYSWAAQTTSWTKIGTVVDAVGSSRKQIYDGVEYDYVFDVDIQEGAPPLKLPYNVTQNPYEAATKFLQNNEMSMNYLDTVADFIVKNSSGTTIGQQQQQSASDPYGTEERYRPGQQQPSQSSQSAPQQPSKYTPQQRYLSISSANLDLITKKLGEVNDGLLKEGQKDICLNPDEVSVITKLANSIRDASKAGQKSVPATIVTDGLLVIIKIITTWSAAQRLPALDLLRLASAYSSVVASYQAPDASNVLDILELYEIFNATQINNAMLATRVFVNMFETAKGRNFVEQNFSRLFDLISPLAVGSGNKNMKIAATTLALNFATLFYKTTASPDQKTRRVTLITFLLNIVKAETDSETLFRALVALGTVLHQVSGHQTREVAGVRTAALGAKNQVREGRIEGVVKEILDLI